MELHVVKFEGGYVCSDNGSLEVGDVWVQAGMIIDPLKLFYQDKKIPDVILDCRGLIVAPGLIDIQLNGAFGVDFSSLKEEEVSESLSKVSRGILQHGVTAYCPTLVTSSQDYYCRTLPLMCPREGGRDGATVLGVHCEGPFINLEKKGAHQKAYIRDQISPSLVKTAYGGTLDNIRIITLASELRGGDATVKWLQEEKGVVVSLGHSMSTLHGAEQAVNCGASLITHLFNAMLPFHHRDPGLVGLLTSLKLRQKLIYFSIIADGNHTDETVLRIAYKSNPEGIILVTDAMAAMGLGDGLHQLGTMTVNVEGKTARLPGTNTLAGSCVSMIDCVKEMLRATNCSKGEALLAASNHPAMVLNLEGQRGTLSCYGAAADMVLLDKDSMDVHATVIAGIVVWKKPGSGVFSGQRKHSYKK